ncbi:cadmium-translocating P-type ATPase [Paenibacillus barcinonensis]|uniref:Cd(2+)-exporting ATPase n=1 Tax=Paenibacillus barcinonensis TaxID=198119 RepID=A0A2V4VJ72_PAEBA|nr:heavy metal translocating P-type ATPase [Paenibacillus barcinonensis]PYE42408.1 Cd2+/Zn2+-exporting ATPase [Paenibacillus barcinonensis]QKS58361.1 cadmium-translocating P-type ATPase [Paenibacillus barcinonensis]
MGTGQEQVKRELLLDGLDCANCALKIENGVSKIKGISECSVNFVTKTLSMYTTSDMDEQVVEEAKRKVLRLEPHIRISEKGQGNSGQSSWGGTSTVNHKGEQGAEQPHSGAHQHHGHQHMAGHAHTHGSHGHDYGHDHAHHDHAHHSHAHGDAESSGAHAGHSHEHGAGQTRTLLARLAAGSVLLAAAIWSPLDGWAQLGLYILAYVIAGGDIVLQAFKNIIRGQVFDEYFLMTVATLGAFAIGEYPEGVAVMLFYQLGELFQGMAVNRSRKSIQSLMDIRPDYANVLTGAGEETRRVSPDQVRIGDRIIVKAGERVPLDGVVKAGQSMVDTSALTGESVPRELKPGSDALSGFVNKNGMLTIEVTKTFGESTVSKILDMVQNASSRKAKTEHFISKFARYYTPVVVILAALIALVPPLLLNGATFADWIYRALVFLVISCPCALVVSIPLGFFGGIGAASRNGILVKGSNYLEALNDVKVVVFDKTGTLTKGVFKVTAVHSQGAHTEEELMRLAAIAEASSNHPIAESIRAAWGKDIPVQDADGYDEVAGHGIKVNVNGQEVLAGNGKLMEQAGIAYTMPQTAGTVVHVAKAGIYIGHIIIADEVKQDAAVAIQALKQLGIRKTVMLTGDATAVGEAVGHQLGVDEVYAELLPQDKVERLEQLEVNKGPKEKIVFVGDGINDTPVLARADVGVAMGGLGSDAAIEAADVVIMTDEPSRLASAIRIAKRTRRIVWQNIGFALGVKAIFLLLGVFGIATMWEAVFSDVGVTVLAVLNAMRVLRIKDV